MGSKRRRLVFGSLAALSTACGCQTNFGGMTLPSPHYLKHPPQYFIPDPTFPLQREQDSMSDPEGASRRGNASGPVTGPAQGSSIPAGTLPR